MPFVLAPNLWSRVSRSSTLERTERAHGDGLQVDLDSPEALDEVYWRVKAGRDYIRKDTLVPHDPEEEDLDGYVDLVRLVLLRTGKDRYLSKNNNNILRLPALERTFPRASFLIPVREPLAHAVSLMRQHARFGAPGGFETAYIGWLGHHEFGATHLPFSFGAVPEGTPDGPDYWLRLWILTYRHLLDTVTDGRSRFVSYEDLCSDPRYRAAVMAAVGLPGRSFAEMRAVPAHDPAPFDAALADEARRLYARVRERSRIGEARMSG